MRLKERIEPFIRRLDLPYLLTIINPQPPKTAKPDAFRRRCNQAIVYLLSQIDYWKDNPDLRFGQLMVNAGFNEFEPIYNREEKEILMMCGYSEIESTMWGSNYSEDGSRRDTTLFRFIDELDTTHLFTMLQEAEMKKRFYSIHMLSLFSEELSNRGHHRAITNDTVEWCNKMAAEITRARQEEMIDFIRKTIG